MIKFQYNLTIVLSLIFTIIILCNYLNNNSTTLCLINLKYEKVHDCHHPEIENITRLNNTECQGKLYNEQVTLKRVDINLYATL